MIVSLGQTYPRYLRIGTSAPVFRVLSPGAVVETRCGCNYCLKSAVDNPRFTFSWYSMGLREFDLVGYYEASPVTLPENMR